MPKYRLLVSDQLTGGSIWKVYRDEKLVKNGFCFTYYDADQAAKKAYAEAFNRDVEIESSTVMCG